MRGLLRGYPVWICAGLTLLLMGCPTTTSRLTILSPGGGESWPQGSTQTLRWESTDQTTGNVIITLQQGSAPAGTITDDAPNTGSYAWAIPRDQAAGSNYSIVMQQGELTATSKTFSIAASTPAISTSAIAHYFAPEETQWSFEVWNSGTLGSLLEFQAAPNKNWLTIETLSGTSTGPNDRKTIQVSINAAALSVGENSGRITLSSSNAGSKSVDVTVFKPRTEIGLGLVSVYDFGFSESDWSFEVWNAGDPGSTLAFTVFTDKAWLNCDPLNGASTGTEDRSAVQVHVDRGLLPAGNNSATITISAEGVGSKSIKITAARPQPAMTLSGNAFDFGSQTTQLAMEVWNTGDPSSVLHFRAATNKEWVTITPDSGSSTGSNDRVTIGISIDRAGLQNGQNTATITFTADGLNAQVINLTALKPAPALSLSGTNHDFGGRNTSWSFDVWNSGDSGSTLDFDVTTSRSWIQCTPSGASSAGPDDRRTISVAVDREALVNGSNSGAITISADGVTSKTINITANKPQPVISVSGGAYDFGRTESSWSFEVWNSGEADSTLQFNAASDSPWITVDPQIGVSANAEDRKTVRVTLNRGLLPANPGTATITLSADSVVSKQVTIKAARAQAAIGVSDTSHDFGGTAAEWSFELWNAGDSGSALSYSISADKEWITCSPAVGSSSSAADRKAITVTIDRTRMPRGSVSGTITISGDGVTSKTIGIVASTPQSAMGVSSTTHDFGGADTSWSFQVWNSGDTGSSLNFRVFTSRSWITCAPDNGSSSGPNDRKTIIVTIDRDALANGSNAGAITISADGVNAQSISVSAIKTQPAISVSGTQYDFGRTETAWSFAVWNSGEPDSDLWFNIAADVPWISVNPLTAASTGASDRKTVTVGVDRSLLPSGANSGTITVSADGLSSKTISVRATKGQAAISISDPSYDFGSTETQWSFQVWNSGDAGASLEFLAASNRPWISIAPENASSADAEHPVSVQVTIDRAGLASGANSGAITISADGTAAKTINITAVKAQPAIAVSSGAHDFGSGGGAWTFDVWNGGNAGSTLNFVVFANKEWIAVAPAQGASNGSEDLKTVTVTVNRALLAAGNNSGAITISAEGLSAKTINITAVKPQPAASVSATSHDFGRTGSDWAFDVWNSGDSGTTLNFIVSADKEWILPDVSSGVSTGYDDPQTVNVAIDRDLLGIGSFSGTITVYAAETGANKQISISVTTPTPAISVSGTMFDFASAQQEGAFSVWNSGDEGTTLRFFATPDKEWLTVNPASGISTGPGDLQTVQISVNRARLNPGNNQGTIAISADGASSRSITIYASTPQPVIGLSSTSFNFGSSASAWSFQIWNADQRGSTLDFTIAPEREWISCEPASGSSTGPGDPQTINVTINRALLLTGSNSGRITINSLLGSTAAINLTASTPNPAISISSDRYDFGKSQTQWSFEVWNSGETGTTLEFDLTPNTNWIACTPDTGVSAGPNDRQTITVDILRDLLPDSSNAGQINISAPGVQSKAVNILAETPQPSITTSATSHQFAVGESEWTFEVWNSGDTGTTLDFLIVDDRDWITCAPDAGSSADASNRAPVTVSINRALVPAGGATGMVSVIADNGLRRDLSISVVLPKPKISLSAQTHNFGSIETTWAFEIWNAGDAGTTLSFQVADDQLWLTCDPSSGSSTDPSDRKTINVTLNRGYLSAGNSSGNIYISAPDTGERLNISVSATQAKAIFVDAAKSSKTTEDGLSWSTAFRTIQAGVDAAAERFVNEVWVAEGMYPETVYLQKGIRLYGGFPHAAGENEYGLSERDAERYPSIIDGENAWNGLIAADQTVVDGFTITGGYAEFGGGMLVLQAAVEVTQCAFIGNTAQRGGAIYCGANSALTLDQCLFTGNAAGDAAGASICVESSNVALVGTAIDGALEEAIAADQNSVITMNGAR